LEERDWRKAEKAHNDNVDDKNSGITIRCLFPEENNKSNVDKWD